MFAPSQHIGRNYGAPGTTRRARNNENAGVHLPTKTPVRAPLGGGPFKPGPGTVGRPLGLKTVERNVLAPKSDHPADDIGPKRLFQNSKPSSSQQQAPLKPMKTPAPTRHHALRTPAPQRLPDPSPLPLPSAQRTRRRSRSSLSSQHSHSTPDQSFATPAPAHRWEEEVSLDSIVEADVEEALNGGEGSDCELEYAPPTAIDRPFIPEWASTIPDPIESMKAIAAMRPLFFHDPPSPPAPLQEVDLPTVTLCSTDALEHPLLRRPKPKTSSVAAKPRLGLAARTPASTSTSRPGVSARPTVRPVTTIPPRPAPSAIKTARPASASGAISSRSTTRPATATGSSAPVRTTARSVPPTPRTATTAVASTTSRFASRPRSGTTATTATTRTICGAPAPAKPKSPLLAPVAAPDLDNFDLGLDLDILGPDPAMQKVEEPVKDVAVAAAEEAVEAHAITGPPDAVPAPEATIPEIPAIETTHSYATEASTDTEVDSFSLAPAPRRPKVTLTAPDTSAEITQDLDSSFIRDAALTPVPGVSESGRLEIPQETAFVEEPESAPPVFDASFEGEIFELKELHRPELPSATNTESWVDDDMSFTDDILAAAMDKCDLDDSRIVPFNDSDNGEGSPFARL